MEFLIQLDKLIKQLPEDCKNDIDYHKCPECGYRTEKKILLKKHHLAVHATEEEKRAEYKYYCEGCAVGFSDKHRYGIHLNTAKHKKLTE